MGRGYVLVEGHGEVKAVGNLVLRLWATRETVTPWTRPIRWKNLHQRAGVEKGANFVRAKGDADALLVLRDEDDLCPRDLGPQMAGWLRELDLPFPAAAVLLKPEYEVLFLPCLPLMAGRPLGSGVRRRPGLLPGTEWTDPWEQRRGIKEWLSRHYPPGRRYKPTTDQLPLTQMIDLSMLRAADVPCFGTLERALRFLATSHGPGEVYPPVDLPDIRNT